MTDDRDPADALDGELLQRWIGGDPRAGDALTHRYIQAIRRYFIRRAPEDHEDLVQETFLQLARARASFRHDAPVRVFLYRIARNVLRMYARRMSRRPQFDPLTTSVVAAFGRPPSAVLAQREEHTILLTALQEVASEDQDLLELRYWRGLTGPELRDLFELPEGTMRSRVRAAVTRLRDKFNELSHAPAREVSDATIERWMLELGTASDPR
jgi:RNA polymerase sigma factor (sigma-70 family)